jgi:hypothetical protein
MTRRDPEDWLLERYHLGEATAEQRQRVEAALAADPTVRERLEALAADDAKTLAAHPPARVAASIRASAAQEPGRSKAPTWWPALALVAAGALVFTVWPVDPDVRTEKGAGVMLSLYAMTPQGPTALVDGAKVKPRDVVQPRFRLDEPAYVALVSFDAAGQVTRHATPTERLEPGTVTTDRSFELDATPGFERFVLVTSQKPIPLDALEARVLEVARSSEPRRTALSLPGAFERSIVLVKETP